MDKHDKKLFDKCYDHLLKNEGGYANHPNDKGGETYKGIARKYHNNWVGWELIDEYKKAGGFPDNAYNDSSLNQLVRLFYKSIFWDKMNLDFIVNENSILQIFDMGVNSGIKTAAKLAQKSCDKELVIDGILGWKTAFEINSLGFRFFDKYVKQRIIYYNGLVAKNPTQNVFLKGWIKRAKNTKFA